MIKVNYYWCEALNKFGFEIFDKDKNLYINNNTKYEQYLRFIPNNRLYKIRLSLGYTDVFKEYSSDTAKFVILSGLLHKDAVIIDGLEIDEEWWDISDQKSLDSFLLFGIRWFKEYSDIERLANFFENEWIQAKKRQIKRLQFKRFIDKYLFRQNYSTTITSPPIHDYYLGLLFYELGVVDKACHYANKWLKFIINRKDTNEPERTLRQIKMMGCNTPT